MCSFRSINNFFLCLLLALLVSCSGVDDSVESVPITTTAAAKFLNQASFGATMTDIEILSDIGYEAWINEQFSLPITKHIAYIKSLFLKSGEIKWRDHVPAWLATSVQAKDQLRQRVAFALSEIWVVSLHGVNFPNTEMQARALTNYYDTLLQHSFGNYRDLMEAVTLNPVMGEYLSMAGNQKANPDKNRRPDENYAREMMQLFTIGLHELNMDGTQKLDSLGNSIPTYTQDDIEAIARVFTGWHYTNYQVRDTDDDAINPLVAYEDRHDRGRKEFLGGYVIPAEQDAEQDLEQFLDIIFNHANVAPFVSKQLIQKLVTSNPSNAYIERVAAVFNDNGSGVRGDMKSVLKAILMDDEAVTGITSNDRIFGKVKEPLVRMVNIWRTFDASAANGEFDLKWFRESLGQSPLEAHHVFNFFSPGFSPQGIFQDNNWVAPEFEIHTEANQTHMTNFIQWLVINRNNKSRSTPNPDDILINLDKETELATDIDALLEHYNLLLFAGEMSAELKAITKVYVETYAEDRPEKRAIEALALLVVSPEFIIQN